MCHNLPATTDIHGAEKPENTGKRPHRNTVTKPLHSEAAPRSPGERERE